MYGYYPPLAVPNVLVTVCNEESIPQGRRSAEVVISKHMFVHYRPIALSSSCLESDRSEQKVNKHLLAESAAYFGLKTVINA